MTVEVRNNDINKALRILKKRMQTEGLFNEMRRKEYHETKGEKRRREKAAGRQRWLKDNGKRLDEYGF